MTAQPFELFSRDGGIYDQNGQRVSIKGVNWFGFETPDFALHGLWCVGMNETLDTAAKVRLWLRATTEPPPASAVASAGARARPQCATPTGVPSGRRLAVGQPARLNT
jgi:hypothetical protein